ncbi:MAG TPA: malto-oligosyltrehalose trehalohydrolase [Cellvibrionaceae bacterium]
MSTYKERAGAFVNEDGTTRFALWAPDAHTVAINLNKNPALNETQVFELSPADDGWFAATIQCGAGTHYSYTIDGRITVPDPASRAQQDDVHSDSIVVDHKYPWKTHNWQGRPWHETVIYELHVGLFGGFAQVEAYLPKLVELGVTAIELMPINEFPGRRNWGYDGILLFAPESSYGTPDQLKSLIDTAHSLGLMVFLDVVYNHFGPSGNYIHEYAHEFFREDIQTPWGAAIDFRKPQVRNFFAENALMWVLDYRVDGLRFDAVHAISEKDFLVELAARIRNVVPDGRYLHLILENEDNGATLLTQGFDAQWNDDGHNILHHLLTNETERYYANYLESPTEKLARCLNEGFIYQGENMINGRPRGEPSSHLPPTAFVLFLQNHDQVGNRAFGERLAILVEANLLKSAVALMLLSPMIPLLFMGEEWGTRQPFLFFTDYDEDLGKAVCEGRRKEFGECAHTASDEAWGQIPDPNAPSTFNDSVFNSAAHNTQEHTSWWNFYQHLLMLRKSEIVPRLVGARSIGVTPVAERALVAHWQLGDGHLLSIYLNLSTQHITLSVREDNWSNKRVLFQHGLGEGADRLNVLPPASIIVTLSENPSDAV